MSPRFACACFSHGLSLILAPVLLALVFCCAPGFAQGPKVLAPHVPVPPIVPRHREWDPPAVSQTDSGGLWMADANFRATLYLTNLLKSDSITVTPVVYLNNGTAYPLPQVLLEASGVSEVNINQALAKQGVSLYSGLTGYVEVQYKWAWPGSMRCGLECGYRAQLDLCLRFAAPIGQTHGC